MSSLASFRAVYCSGLFIESPSLVTELSLLFEKVHLLNNIEFICEFAKNFEFETDIKEKITKGLGPLLLSVDISEDEIDPFDDLNQSQRNTAENYILYCSILAYQYRELFPEVFESDMFSDGLPPDINVAHKGRTGTKHHLTISLPSPTLVSGEPNHIPVLINQGYVPVIGHNRIPNINKIDVDNYTAKQLAALLGMQSLNIVLPATQVVEAETILEARYRLRQHLPQFWAAMLRLSAELKVRLQGQINEKVVMQECIELVDTIVRPASIDLQKKMELERKDWFYKILAPVGRSIRLLLGFPGMSQQDLLMNSLILGSDVTMTSVEHMRRIETLKGEAGLTFLIEAETMLTQ
jgi:hypothetical protein